MASLSAWSGIGRADKSIHVHHNLGMPEPEDYVLIYDRASLLHSSRFKVIKELGGDFSEWQRNGLGDVSNLDSKTSRAMISRAHSSETL